MSTQQSNTKRLGLAGLGLVSAAVVMAMAGSEPEQAHIVQGQDLAAARAAVIAAGGDITHELGIIRAVGAELSATEVESLRAENSVRIYEDRRVETARKRTNVSTQEPKLEVETTAVPVAVGADALHEEGITGDGVVVAFVDWRRVRTARAPLAEGRSLSKGSS